MFSGVVLLDFEEIFLGMGTDLNYVLGLNVLLDLFPVTSMLFESVQKGLMFVLCPIFPVFRDDIGLPRLLRGDWIACEGTRSGCRRCAGDVNCCCCGRGGRSDGGDMVMSGCSCGVMLCYQGMCMWRCMQWRCVQWRCVQRMGGVGCGGC